MDREISLDIVRSSWPRPPRVPSFPSQFVSAPATIQMNVPVMLMMIGYLTTPAAVTGLTLSEFWAWVRYLAAVTPDSELRLTSAFTDLDAHQKTILSDDFGMGVPMLWLTEQFDFDRIVDGRYFMLRLAASMGATARRIAKRGPSKTPDFVARDTAGIWHVIECKGTQSGDDYCRRQLGIAGPPPTGGIAQKRSVIFPRGHTGQRLVCGLTIASAGKSGRTRLRVVDPPPEEDPFEVTADELGLADDAASRAAASRALRLAGFPATADLTAAPMGRAPGEFRRASGRVEERRQKDVEERTGRAEEELGSFSNRRRVVRDGQAYRGRMLSFDLPRPLIINGRRVESVSLMQAINEQVLRELRARPHIEEPLGTTKTDWEETISTTRYDATAKRSQLRIGELFISELKFEG